MQSVASAALNSWPLDPLAIALLSLIALVYVRGWIRVRQQVRHPHDTQRLSAFLGGLALVFLATESPLDAFDSLYLSAHMTQHLLLMMFAPALILLGDPLVPLLRGLPKAFVKEGLGPFLTWPPLRRFFSALTSPPVAWLLYAISTIAWHVPYIYELALGSPRWHAAQHASFFWTGILFWWPVIRPGPSRSHWPAWIGIPYLMLADLLNTALSAFFIFSGKLLYHSYTLVHMSGTTAQEDQTLAGAIMWVPGSVVYLIPVVVIAIRLLSPQRGRVTLERRRGHVPKERRVVAPVKLLRPAQYLMLLLAALVVCDGLFGPRVAPLNLAGVLPWIHWRALSVVALLLVGNLFCMACPFTLARDLARKLLPARARWPHFLRNKWLPVTLIAAYLWTYEADSLWDKPLATAYIILGYFVAAIAVDGFFRGASFCKYVCPIGQFHFVSSLVSPREVAVRKRAVCDGCQTYDCIRGNEHARGCELYLFQPKKAGNMDCTFCLDCVKACPHDNVALISIVPAKTLTADPYRSGVGRLSRRTDIAALALLITFGAFLNAAGMLHLPQHSLAFVVAGLLLPVAALAVFARRFVYALVPVGFGMWLAHLLYHLVTSWKSAWPPVQRIIDGSMHSFPSAFLPPWLTPLQILMLDAGLLLTLYVFWRLSKRLAILLPWAALSLGLYAAGLWILFQPMQMRGMMMH